MEDITPKLIEAVTKTFRELYQNSSRIQSLLKMVEEGTADYADAQAYSLEVSRLIGKAYEKHVSSAALPDGKMYYNIASRLVPSTVDENHALVSQYALKVQKALNTRAGIGLKAQEVKQDPERVDGLVELAASGEVYDDVAGKLTTAFETYNLGIVDSSIKKNADFQYDAGMTPKVFRKSTGRCCPWCRALVGKYDYPDVPRDVWRRHANCRCLVEYDPADGKGKVQNVHTKKWTDQETADKIEMRKSLGTLPPSGRRYMADIPILKSVGAKTKNYKILDPNTGDHFQFAEGSRIRNVEVFAGLGSKKALLPEVAKGLSEQLGGKPERWQHCKGMGTIDYSGEERPAEVHWFQEESVGRVKFKVKRWLDES